MAIQFLSTDSIGTGVRYTLSAEDGVFVDTGVAIASTDNMAFKLESDISAYVAGTVFGAVNAFGVDTGKDGGGTFTVADTGRVVSDSDSAFRMTLLNEVSPGVREAANCAITNWGEIHSHASSAITLSGWVEGDKASGDAFIGNYGLISTGLAGGYLGVLGIVAVLSTSADVNIVNGIGGVIKSTEDNGGIYVSGRQFKVEGTVFSQGHLNLQNQGEIYSQKNAVHVEDFAQATIVNSGLIQGAIQLANDQDSLVNTGAIQGDVNLGGDNDFFANRGGVVLGTINGGDGDDVYEVDDSRLILKEESNQGGDAVFADVNWVLGDNFEQLFLIGTDDHFGHGNDMANFISGNAGDNKIVGRAGEDTLSGGHGDDKILGGKNSDVLIGGGGYDKLIGNKGNDSLEGDDGDDFLKGGFGKDTLVGGDGSDTLVGGKGKDILTGGDDVDHFVFSSVHHSKATASNADEITDFAIGEDVIVLTDLVPEEISFLGSGAFTAGGSAELRLFVTGGGDTRVYLDLNGDGGSDMRIDVLGTNGLIELDFLL